MANKSKSEEKIERKLDWQCQSIDKCIEVIMGLLGCDRDAAFEFARTRTRVNNSNNSIKTTKKNNPLYPPTGGGECVSSEKVEFTPPKFKPPTIDEIKDYFKQQGFESNPTEFYNYYASKEWDGVKQWRFSANNWEIKYSKLKSEAETRKSKQEIKEAFEAKKILDKEEAEARKLFEKLGTNCIASAMSAYVAMDGFNDMYAPTEICDFAKEFDYDDVRAMKLLDKKYGARNLLKRLGGSVHEVEQAYWSLGRQKELG